MKHLERQNESLINDDKSWCNEFESMKFGNKYIHFFDTNLFGYDWWIILTLNLNMLI